MTKDNHKLGEFELSGIAPAPRGVPQIEVEFEVDANGILNVGAEDKGTGSKEKITITNDSGRLSQEEIERMVQEAEEFAEEDKAVKEKIDARNTLESYVYSIKSQLDDKMEETIEEALKEALDWLDDNQDAEREDYVDKRQELEDTANPIIARMYENASPDDEEDEDDLDDHDEL